MANSARLEVNSWIETVRSQLDQASQIASNHGSGTPEPSEAQAALIALEDLHKLLTTRAEEMDLHEVEFLERSRRLEAAATQLENQFKQFSAADHKSAESPLPGNSSSGWNPLDAFPQAAQTATTQPLSTDIADSIAERVASQLSLMLDAKLQQFNFQAAGSWPSHLRTDAVTDTGSNAATSNMHESHFEQHRDANANFELTARLAELQCELSAAQASLCDNELIRQHAQDEAATKLAEVRKELSAVYESNAALQAELVIAKETVWSLNEHPSDSRATATSFANESTGAALIEELHAEIESLHETLAAVRSNRWATDSRDDDANHAKSANSADDENDANTRMNAEIADLREQNADLATQLARLQMAGSHIVPHLNLSKLNQESMTWEQRKRLILQQLENETAATNPEEYQNHRNEVEEILRTTQAEIDRREAEIAELKSIVQQQSNTHEGLAIGAAAIAQMLDSDELVKLEREKLVGIQKEWETKLREAEIEMSLERAKLSRERAELEERLRNPVEAAKPATPEPVVTIDGKPVRRWLEHLGLRDK